LAVKSEECQALMTDLQRANTQLSDVDSQTADIAEKVPFSLFPFSFLFFFLLVSLMFV